LPVYAQVQKSNEKTTAPLDAIELFDPWQQASAAFSGLSRYLGLSLAEILQELGPPDSLASSRGTEAWQDSVIFYYSDHSYIYWWQDRVWQLRLDKRHSEDIAGIRMGMDTKTVLDRLGPPRERSEKILRWTLPDQGYPVELLLYFDKDQLSDLYIRRADF